MHRDARLFNEKRFAWKDVLAFSLSLFGWSPVRDGTALRVDQPQGPQRGRVDLRSTELEHLPRCGGSTTYHVKGPGPVNREL